MKEILGGQNMFETEQITRRCLMTLSDGSKTQATITIPKPSFHLPRADGTKAYREIQ